jgi:hypothetical protein
MLPRCSASLKFFACALNWFEQSIYLGQSHRQQVVNRLERESLTGVDGVFSLRKWGNAQCQDVCFALPNSRGEDCAAMNFVEIATRKLVSLLGIFVLLVVDSQVRLRVFRIAVHTYETRFPLGIDGWSSPRFSFRPLQLFPG